MNILVTGGAGFIGSHFVDYLLEISRESNINKIVIIDKLTYAGNLKNLKIALQNPNVIFLKDDICTVTLDNLNIYFDWIVNFAAETHVDRSLTKPSDFIFSNIVGTQNLLEYCRNNQDTKFLQVSTDEVYGSIEIGSWTEKECLNPRSPYSASKAAADLIALSYSISFGLDIRVTRCSNNYGTRQNEEKMIPKIIRQLAKGKAVPVYGDGRNIRDWLSVNDHIRGIWLAMIRGERGGIYNIGGGVEMNNLKLVNLIAQKMKITNPKIEFVEDRKGHDYRYSLDYSKASKELGYFPQSKLINEIPIIIESYANVKS